MPPLRPSPRRRSVRLQAQSKVLGMNPFSANRGDPQSSSISQTNPAAPPKAKAKARAAASHPTPAPPAIKSQVKRTRKRAQENNEGSSAPSSVTVYWERYPYLTEKLLSWLWDNPADRAILFNEKRDQHTKGTAKAHGRTKKDINAIIAEIIFRQDLIYGELYATQPGKFGSVVSGCLATYVFYFLHVNYLLIFYSLKTKYRNHASRFKSTGGGISPNDPNHQNLLGMHSSL